MKLSKLTSQTQEILADYCRTGIFDNQIAEIASQDRLKHYRRLVKNNVNNIINQAFPITKKILSEDLWDTLCYDFFIKHDCQTPQIWKMPFEFYLFIKTNQYAKKLKKPYLADLLYFEWLEIEIHTMSDIPISDFQKEGDFFKDKLIFTKESKIITLNYPVHLKITEGIEEKKGHYFIIGFRNWDTKRVHFLNIGLFHALFIETIITNGVLIEEALEQVCKKLDIATLSTQDIKKNILPILTNMKEKGFLMGFDSV